MKKESTIYCGAVKTSRIKSAYCPDLDCKTCPELAKEPQSSSSPSPKSKTSKSLPAASFLSKIKMDHRDRLEAVRRSKEYISDWQAWPPHEPHYSSYRQEMIQKWGICDFPQPLRSYVARECQAINDRYDSVNVVSSIDPSYPPLTLKKLYPNNPMLNCLMEELAYSQEELDAIRANDGHLLEGRYLYLRVDILEDETDIKDEVMRTVKYYKSHLPKNNSRIMGMKRDPWHVYDLETQGNIKADIARELSGKKGTSNPHYDGNTKVEYDSADRAYKKAIAMIKQVETEAQERIKQKVS